MLTNAKDLNQWQLLCIVGLHWKSIWHNLARLNIHVPNEASSSASNLHHSPPAKYSYTSSQLENNIHDSAIKNKKMEAIKMPIFRRLNIIAVKMNGQWLQITICMKFINNCEWIEQVKHDSIYNTILENWETKLKVHIARLSKVEIYVTKIKIWQGNDKYEVLDSGSLVGGMQREGIGRQKEKGLLGIL